MSSSLYTDFGAKALAPVPPPSETVKRKFPEPSLGGKIPKLSDVRGAGQLKWPSSSIDPGFGDSPANDDSIPSLLELPMSSGSKGFGVDMGGAGQSVRPLDPLGNKLTPKEVLETLPEHVKKTLETIQAAGVGNSEQTGRLKFYLNTVMHEGKNPFPIIRLYKEFIGGDQLGRVLNAGMVRKLDYFWENWKVPVTNPAFEKMNGGKQTVEMSKNNWLKLEKLGPPRDAPKIIKEDPLSYKPEDINGVARDPDTGRYVATTASIRWIRSIAFTIHRSGKKEEQYEPFLDLMRGYFGDAIVQKAMNPAQEARLERAEAAFAESGEEGEKKKDSDPTTVETDNMRFLMHHCTSRHIPGVTGEESRMGFTIQSSQWIRDKIERMLALCLNPDPFVRKLTDMFREPAMLRVFKGDVSRMILAGIRNLPEAIPEPTFLTGMIKQASIGDALTSARSVLAAGAATVAAPIYGRPVHPNLNKPIQTYGREPVPLRDLPFGVSAELKKPLFPAVREMETPYGRPPLRDGYSGSDDYPRRAEMDQSGYERDGYDYFDRPDTDRHLDQRFRAERERYEEYRQNYDERFGQEMADPRPLMPPRPRPYMAPRHPMGLRPPRPVMPGGHYMGVHMRMPRPRMIRPRPYPSW